MGFFSAIGGAVATGLRAIEAIPVVGGIAREIPILGTAINTLDEFDKTRAALGSAFPSLDTPSALTPGSRTVVSTTTGTSIGQRAARRARRAIRQAENRATAARTGNVGGLPALPGLGGGGAGALALPPIGGLPTGLTTEINQLNIPHSIPLTQGRLSMRPPRGYVTVEFANTKFFMLKHLAISQRLWKRPRKPPISVGQWSALRGANSTIKKLKRINKMAAAISGFKAPAARKPANAQHHHHKLLGPASK